MSSYMFQGFYNCYYKVTRQDFYSCHMGSLYLKWTLDRAVHGQDKKSGYCDNIFLNVKYFI